MKKLKPLPWLGLLSLSQLVDKTVRITTKDGQVFEGDAVSYTSKYDALVKYDSIGIDKGTYILDLNESEIKDIQIIS